MTLDHVRSKNQCQKGPHMTLIDSKETQNQPKVNNTQGTHASRTTKRRQKKNVNKRFQENGTRNHDETDDASQIKTK
jgi:hypothetical protein